MRGVLLIYLTAIVISNLSGQNDGGLLILSRMGQSARTAAMGGHIVSIRDSDPHLLQFNPAVMNSDMHQQFSLTQIFHLADIKSGSASYVHHLKSVPVTLGVGISYLDFGRFNRTNELRERLGTFSGKETMLTLAASTSLIDHLSIGLSAQYLSSQFAEYTSHALVVDFGVNHYNEEKKTSWSLVLNNIGTQLNSYDQAREQIPIQLLIGWSKRLEHLPFILSVTLHDIDRWHLETVTASRNPSENNRSPIGNFINDFFRHVALGGELLIGKRELITLRVGYDHQRNVELSNSVYRGFEGLSYGIGVKASFLQFDYGIANYHLGGSTHHLGLRVDVHKLFHRL